MTPTEAAAEMNGKEYTQEGTREFFSAMKDAGLVAVFGASDDLMEFRGAIHDEVDCCDGGTAYLNSHGLMENRCDDDNCPYFAEAKERAAKIDAVWDEDDISWQYRTDIPHVTFDIMEDGEVYCRGIVFALADVL